MDSSESGESRRRSKKKRTHGFHFSEGFSLMLRAVLCMVGVLLGFLQTSGSVLRTTCQKTLGRWRWVQTVRASRAFWAAVMAAALLAFAATGGVATLLRVGYRFGRLSYRSTTWGGAAVEPLVLQEDSGEPTAGLRTQSGHKKGRKRGKEDTLQSDESQEAEGGYCDPADLKVLGCAAGHRPKWCAHVDYDLMEERRDLRAGQEKIDMIGEFDPDFRGQRRRSLASSEDESQHSWTNMVEQALGTLPTSAPEQHNVPSNEGGPEDASSSEGMRPWRSSARHRIALCIVGDATALATDPMVHESLLKNLVAPSKTLSQVDSFFNLYNIPQSIPLSSSDSASTTTPPPPPPPQLCTILAKFNPVSVHVIRRPSCLGNSSATSELQCCNPTKLRKASEGWYGTKGRPFDVHKHAAGLLEYYHIRECYREVVKHEERASIEYSMVVRVRPDLIALRPPTVSFASLSAASTGSVYFDGLVVGSGQRGAPAPATSPGLLGDHFFAVSRVIAHRFFEKLLLQSLERFAAAPWATTKAIPLLLNTATSRSAAGQLSSSSIFDISGSPPSAFSSKDSSGGGSGGSRSGSGKSREQVRKENRKIDKFSSSRSPASMSAGFPKQLGTRPGAAATRKKQPHRRHRRRGRRALLAPAPSFGENAPSYEDYYALPAQSFGQKAPHEELAGRVPNCLTGPIRRNAAHGLTEWLRAEERRSEERRKRHSAAGKNGRDIMKRQQVYLRLHELRWGMFAPSTPGGWSFVARQRTNGKKKMMKNEQQQQETLV